jgi:hypothetical protein
MGCGSSTPATKGLDPPVPTSTREVSEEELAKATHCKQSERDSRLRNCEKFIHALQILYEENEGNARLWCRTRTPDLGGFFT